MQKRNTRNMARSLFLLAFSFLAGLSLSPVQAQENSDSEYNILLGGGGILGSNTPNPLAIDDSLLAGSNPQLNNSTIIQQGNHNTARQFSIGSKGTVTAQYQIGDNNESDVLMLGTTNSGVLVSQLGNNHSSNISLYNTQGTNVFNFQTGKGKTSSVFVIGNAGVIVGNQLYLNDTGKPIKDVIIIGKK